MVLAVNAWDEPENSLRQFVKQLDLRHRVLANGRPAAESYGVTSVPVVLWIDREGVVADVETRFKDADSLERRTRDLLAGR